MTLRETPYLSEFREQRAFPLDAFQLAACESLEAGSSVLVAAPTGAGKTTVAEFAIALALGKEQAKVFYTAPIKALSNQKFRELAREYGEHSVGLLTGDANVRGDAPIVVMTTEVLRNMIYEGSRDLDDLAYVILDEVHYLGDRHRGAVWEEIILHLPGHVRLVSLSATVSNAEEFGDWLHTVRGNTDVIVSDHRPVPLYQHVLTRKQLYPLLVDRRGELAEHGRVNPELVRLEQGGSRRGRARGARVSRADLARMLEETRLLPGIVFIFSRAGCDQAVRQCLFEGVRLTTRDERDEIRRIVREQVSVLPDEDLRVLGFAEWLSGLERGIAAHHAGLIPTFKHVVEMLFQRRLLKIVFATETLALGINMPAKSVTIEQLEKFNGTSRVPLTPGEYTQLTGRAGRRGIDTEGHALIVWDQQGELDTIARLSSKRLYPLTSTFTPTYNMAVNLLARMDLDQARSILELSFAQFQADRGVVELAQEVQSQQASMEGYRKTIERTSGSEQQRWVRRLRKLERQTRRQLKDMSNRTGSIARTFDRVVRQLTELDYLEIPPGDSPAPTPWGQILRMLYGERDLLIVECLRERSWQGITSTDLAALACTLVYEPRRESDVVDAKLPRGAFAEHLARTWEHWERLDALEASLRLTRSEQPHPGAAFAMYGWARGDAIGVTLERSGMGPGDFVRVAKQTIDVLDQLAGLPVPAGVNVEDREHLSEIQQRAREAREGVLRGIVESSRGA